MLANIKILLGISDTSKDNILNILIDNATAFVKGYCHIDSVTGLEGVIEELVILRYNLLGCEGLESESYSGVDFSYSDELPDNIYKELRAHRRLLVW